PVANLFVAGYDVRMTKRGGLARARYFGATLRWGQSGLPGRPPDAPNSRRHTPPCFLNRARPHLRQGIFSSRLSPSSVQPPMQVNLKCEVLLLRVSERL